MSVSLRPDDLVLVTGGSGFLGSAVARALIARGCARARSGSFQQSARQSRGPGLRDRRWRPHRPGVLESRDARRPLPVPCRGGLSFLGARSLGHPARECRRHAQPDAGSTGGRRRTDRLHQQRRGAQGRRRHEPCRRNLSACRTRGHRRLQAQQDPGGTRGRGDDPAGQAAGHHRQSDDAHRSARHQADADGTHPSGCGARQDPGLRRHRAELRPRRRYRRGSPSRLRARPHR